jgi:myo-inositol catabolism protein IolC
MAGNPGWPPRHDDPLFILAMDHRESFGKTLFGVKDDDPDPTQAVAMRAAKRLIFEGLRTALPSVTSGRAGVLVDERYGQDVIDAIQSGGQPIDAIHSGGQPIDAIHSGGQPIDAIHSGGQPVMLAVPVEASGHDWFTLEWGDQWLDHVEAVKPDYAKVLIRDNPDFDAARRAAQLGRLAQVSAGLREAGVPLLYELLVPATAAQLNQAGQDAGAYDRDIRPGLVARVIADNQAHGVEPALWKVEGLETVDAARQVARQAKTGGRAADLIVLGRDAPAERLDHWLEVASQVEEFVGFAIGRSIWEDVVREYEGSELGAAAAHEARGKIAERYLGFIAHWAP